MVNPDQKRVLDLLCHGDDPFGYFPKHLYARDSQGWNSRHEFLKWSIMDLKRLSAGLKPTVIVEIGVWKGGSTIELAEGLMEQMQRGVVIAVDTWLGSSEHRLVRDNWEHLCPEYGYPTLYRKFIANVIHAGVQNFVVPLAIDGFAAGVCIKHVGLRPDIIHLDAAHEYEAVKRDLQMWWPLLADGGIFIFDDYDKEFGGWPGVKRAVDELLAEVPHEGFGALGMKARVTKVPPSS